MNHQVWKRVQKCVKKVYDKPMPNLPDLRTIRWSSPIDDDAVARSVDWSIHSDPKQACCGGVCRDNQGNLLFEFYEIGDILYEIDCCNCAGY